jgi:hypothetical protein
MPTINADIVSLLICLFFTLYNTGVIWVLQLNHYPLYVKVGQHEFRDYLTAHNGRILLPIVLPSIAAFISSLLLLWRQPVQIPNWSLWLVNLLNAATLLSTIFVQGPAHNQLARGGYSEILIRKIITTNWLRTIAWTVNGLLLLWVTAMMIGAKKI